MKVVILAGGFGTRISEESHLRPKPMVEIGGMPMLWHIMKYYASFGYSDFIVCAGYKQSVIKEWFADYYINHSDVTFDFSARERITVHTSHSEPWRVTVVDTGLSTMTGGRIKRIRQYLEDAPFFSHLRRRALGRGYRGIASLSQITRQVRDRHGGAPRLAL